MPDGQTEPSTSNSETPAAATPPAEPTSAPAQEPSSPAEVLLGDGAGISPSAERELWTGRTSWRHFYGQWAIWLLVMVLFLAGAIWLRGSVESIQSRGLLWFVGLLCVVVVGSALIMWIRLAIKIFSVRYRLTTQRLFVERGLLSRTTDQSELIRVDDVRVRQGVVQRIVNVGQVDVLSTDVSDADMTLVGVQSPDKIAEHIRQHMRTLRKKSLFVENL